MAKAMNGLLRQFPPISLANAPAGRRHSLRPGAILALLAVLVITMLSTWHGATIHEDHLPPVAFNMHEHGYGGQTDNDDPVHVAAHAASHGIFAESLPTTWIIKVLPVRLWESREFMSRAGIDPTKLLRPPRA